MAHFYGKLKGARGEVTRCGTRNSGLSTVAASWQGCVAVTLSEQNGIVVASVYLRPWHGHGVECLLYHGPVGQMPLKFKGIPLSKVADLRGEDS